MEIAAKIFVVGDSSAVPQARRIVAGLGQNLGLNETEIGRAAIIVTELGTNLLKHGDGGELLAEGFSDADGSGLQILSLDKGQGMANIEQCMHDGFSTAGSAGGGLGAIRRLSDRFDIASWPGLGTAVLARLYRGGPPKVPNQTGWGGLCLPMHGENVSGDAWSAREYDGKLTLLVADGLGHGPLAASASQAATALFSRFHALQLEDLAARLHDALRPSRGAAIALARLDAAAKRVDYVGIGNISGTLIAGGETRKMLSHNGTAGHNARKIQNFKYEYSGAPLLLLHSDGLATSWALERYPGLVLRDPALIAGVLYRDFSRGRDDVTVIAAKSPA